LTGAQLINLDVERRRRLALDAVIAHEARQADRLSRRIGWGALQPGWHEEIEALMRQFFAEVVA